MIAELVRILLLLAFCAALVVGGYGMGLQAVTAECDAIATTALEACALACEGCGPCETLEVQRGYY